MITLSKNRYLHLKGRPNEKVLLTGDCFKRLCMLSRTSKAEEVRSYFLALEKHIDKYKNHVIESLTRKVEMYEKNVKTLPRKDIKQLKLKNLLKNKLKTRKKLLA